MKQCLFCNKLLISYQQKYCSNLCQANHRYTKFIKLWLSGVANGTIGIKARNTSRYIKRYLIETCGEKCSLCGWSKKNVITNRVPIEIDHINGDSEDSTRDNLRLICPNCHSLSSNFRNLNIGHGRTWRKNKYMKNILS